MLFNNVSNSPCKLIRVSWLCKMSGKMIPFVCVDEQNKITLILLIDIWYYRTHARKYTISYTDLFWSIYKFLSKFCFYKLVQHSDKLIRVLWLCTMSRKKMILFERIKKEITNSNFCFLLFWKMIRDYTFRWC